MTKSGAPSTAARRVNAADAGIVLAERSLFEAAVKRTLDIVGALAGLLVTAGVYLWFRRVVQRESPGPVFYRQMRVGRGGKPFMLYKFRSMIPDAEQRLAKLFSRNEMTGPVFKVRDDPRVFPTGRWLRHHYLDELPQFWNVLRGEMSLVGPRPPVPEEVAGYEPHHFVRLAVKPGISGTWQIVRDPVTDFEEIVRLDREYVEHGTILTDWKILYRTVRKAISGGGW